MLLGNRSINRRPPVLNVKFSQISPLRFQLSLPRSAPNVRFRRPKRRVSHRLTIRLNINITRRNPQKFRHRNTRYNSRQIIQTIFRRPNSPLLIKLNQKPANNNSNHMSLNMRLPNRHHKLRTKRPTISRFQKLRYRFRQFPLSRHYQIPLIKGKHKIYQPTQQLNSATNLPSHLKGRQLIRTNPTYRTPRMLQTRSPIKSQSSRQHYNPRNINSTFHTIRIRPVSLKPSRRLSRQGTTARRVSSHLITKNSTRITQVRPLANRHRRNLPSRLLIRIRHTRDNLTSHLIKIRHRSSLTTIFILVRRRTARRLSVLFTRHNTANNRHDVSPNRITNRRINMTLRSSSLLTTNSLLANGIRTMRSLQLIMRQHLKDIRMLQSIIIKRSPTNTRTSSLTKRITSQPRSPTPRAIMKSAITTRHRPKNSRFIVHRTHNTRTLSRIIPT